MARKKKNLVLEKLPVETYAAEGKCIAHHEGKVVFIEKCVPGDVVDVRLTKSKKDWAQGHPIYFHELSKDRVEPFCQHFGVCGGCQWQMLPYEKQLEYKAQQVRDQLARIGHIAVREMLPIAGADVTRGYRNKMEYTFANKRFVTDEELKADGEIDFFQPTAGFHARGVFDKIVAIEKCHLQEEPTNLIREIIRQTAIDLGMPFYDIKMHTGWLRNVQIRLLTTGDLMVNVVVAHEHQANLEILLQTLLKQVPEITTLYYTINQKWNDSMMGLEPKLYFGPPHAKEKLEDFEFLISPQSFFQTNTRQAEKLYQITRDFAELTGQEVLYDLYCGTGSIGIFCSKKASRIIGVEMVEEAIADAHANAALNQLDHCRFFAGDVAKICTPEFFETHGRPDVIITDPPRAGMHEKLVQQILEMGAPVVVYVSCNPATQARDLKLLSEKYAVTRIQPVDMFPHTLHIENVAQLKLKKPRDK